MALQANLKANLIAAYLNFEMLDISEQQNAAASVRPILSRLISNIEVGVGAGVGGSVGVGVGAVVDQWVSVPVRRLGGQHRNSKALNRAALVYGIGFV
jgi:hypothetical protein